MNKLPVITAKELARILEKAGFSRARQRGSHAIFTHPDGRLTIIPIHPGEDIGRGLLRKVIRDLGLTREEFQELLKDPS